jgi:outer membrane protein assembly factor BamB
MVNQQRSAIILFCFVFLIAFLASSCIYNAVSSEEPVEAAVTEIPTITEAPDTIEKTEPTPLPTPTEPAGNIVTVYNARQLLSNMVSNRHIRLVPGGDYDLASISLASSIFYGLDNLTLEGVGEIPVAVHTKNMESVVMSFSNCSNITFINLDLSHTAPVSPNNNCKGKVLAFYDNTADITIKNCILSGCGITGLYATNTTNLYCEDTIIRDCSMSIMDIDRLRSATFTRCTFKADNSQVIKLSQCRDTLFSDCLFTGEYWLPSVRIGDWSPYEEANRNLYAKTINMEKTEQGILIEKSVLARDDYADLCRQFKDNLSSCLPAYPFDIDISWEETLGSAALCMKTPVTFKNIQEEYQLCFDNIMLSMKDLPLPEAELFLEIGPIYAGYPNFNNLLERARNGEKISFWETDFINLGDLDAGLINPENNKYLSTQQACENLLQQLPLPVSTNDDEPFVNIADVVTGKTTLIYDDGRLFYLFKDFSYGAEENIGYDGFCIDAATGTLNKFHDEGYVEVSSADKVLIADIIGYLEKSGAVIAPNDWIKVQIYDNDVASVYFGARLYFQLKMTKTSEGTVFEPYKMKSQSEGDISSDIAELSNKNNPPVQQLNDEYDLKWTFSEEMMVHFILGKIGNTLLVYGHDGGISGYHSDEYLYGLDAETGKKIWSVYGGYLGIASVLSRKDGKVYAGIKAHDWDPPRLICLDVVTGAILWEKGLSRQSYSIMD